MIKLYRGDCLDVLKRLPSGSVDAVVTDPPYGMKWNTDSRRFSGGRPSTSSNWASGRGRKDWGEITGDDAPFDPEPWLSFPKVVLWGFNHFASRLPVGTTLIWIKKSDRLFGSFLSDAEVAWMKGGHGVYCYRKNFATPTRRHEGGGRSLHPMQKSLALMSWCIERLKLKPGSTILDPYMGSGTTGVAACQTGHNFIGIEINPEYHAIARRRIRAAQKAEPVTA